MPRAGQNEEYICERLLQHMLRAEVLEGLWRSGGVPPGWDVSHTTTGAGGSVCLRLRLTGQGSEACLEVVWRRRGPAVSNRFVNKLYGQLSLDRRPVAFFCARPLVFVPAHWFLCPPTGFCARPQR